MERILQQMGRGQQAPGKRILEVNPDHPVVQSMQQLVTKDRSDARLEPFARLLYDQALILEGSKVKDPLALARRINELLLKDTSAA
jgi:molecular chaperone HtpG